MQHMFRRALKGELATIGGPTTNEMRKEGSPFLPSIRNIAGKLLRPILKKFRLPAGADAVLEDRSAVLGHRYIELRREGRGLRVLVGGREHLPIAADGLVDLDHDGCVLVIAQRDLILEFPSVSIDVFVVDLFVLGDDVEGVADMDADLFVLGSVVDAVFPGEEDAAL